jgi:TolB protein
VLACARDWAPRWSPDEREIVFYSARSGDREIWVMPAAGGAARRLTHTPGMDSVPSWSPDGGVIVYRSERPGNSEIWTVTSDGHEERQLTQDPSADYGPAFSPDRQWLAFSSNRSGTLDLWRMPAKGGAAELLSAVPTVSPVWSPDGTRLYFGPVEGTARLWAFSLEDRTERLVADLTGRPGSLGFQQPGTDGKYLYISWRSDVSDIWVMDVAEE